MSDVPHIGFIVAAYLVAAAAILAMIGAILFDYRSLSRALAKLEATRRRSGGRVSGGCARAAPFVAAACWRRCR